MIAEPIARETKTIEARIQEGIESVLENGYYVVENALSPAQYTKAVELLDELIARGESDGNGEDGGFGYHVSPLCPRNPHFCEMLCNPVVLGVAAGVLEDEPILKVNGMRVSETGRHISRLGWHIHRYTPAENALHVGSTERGARPQRLLCTWYMEGCNEQSGPLVIFPRRFDDALAPPLDDSNAAWPGEIHVSCPPGSGVVFSADMWHAALAGTSRERRHLIGVQFQGKGNPRAHREDEVFEGAVIDEVVCANPTFARLIGRE